MNVIDIPKSWDSFRIKVNDKYSMRTFGSHKKSELSSYHKESYYALKAELEREKPRVTYVDKYRGMLAWYWVVYTKDAETERWPEDVTNRLTFDEAMDFINKVSKVKKIK